jgi:hypothetical protein
MAKKKAERVNFGERFVPIGLPEGSNGIAALLNCGVCAAPGVTYEEALGYVRRTNPAGTSNNWVAIEDGPNTVDCPDVPGRKHYVFTC